MKTNVIIYSREELHLRSGRFPVSATGELHFKCQKTLGIKLYSQKLDKNVHSMTSLENCDQSEYLIDQTDETRARPSTEIQVMY